MIRSRSLDQILASCSDSLFPAEMGRAPVQIDSVDCDGDTPLHVMLWRKDTEAALMLVAAGAKVNAVGDMSETPLHVAVRQQDISAIAALLAAGARPDAVSEFGESPRSMAAALGGRIRKLFGGNSLLELIKPALQRRGGGQRFLTQGEQNENWHLLFCPTLRRILQHIPRSIICPVPIVNK